jgi:hypothetical protein
MKSSVVVDIVAMNLKLKTETDVGSAESVRLYVCMSRLSPSR